MREPFDNLPAEKEARPLFRIGAAFLALCSLFVVVTALRGDRSAFDWGLVVTCGAFGIGMGFIAVTGRYPPIL